MFLLTHEPAEQDTEASQCTGLKTGWDYMKTNQTFPVPAGTVVTLSCNEGFQQTGDRLVTCLNGTRFKFKNEPECGCKFPVKHSPRVIN